MIDELGLNETDVYYIIPDDAGVVALFGDNQIPEEKRSSLIKTDLSASFLLTGFITISR